MRRHVVNEGLTVGTIDGGGSEVVGRLEGKTCGERGSEKLGGRGYE